MCNAADPPVQHRDPARVRRNTSIEVRYVGNTNIGDTYTWDINSSANWSMLAGENGFYDEFRRAQANLRANILAGNGTTFAFTGAPGTSPLPIFQAFFAGTPLNSSANQNPASYTARTTAHRRGTTSSTTTRQLPHPASPALPDFGTSGLQNTTFETNRDCRRAPGELLPREYLPRFGQHGADPDRCRQRASSMRSRLNCAAG